MIQSSAQNHIFYNDVTVRKTIIFMVVSSAQKWGVRNHILRICVCAHPT